MSVAIVWTPRALHDFYRLPWRRAAEVDAAVQEFARSGDGDLRLVTSDTRAPLRLHVSPHVVSLSLTDGVLHVWGIGRSSG